VDSNQTTFYLLLFFIEAELDSQFASLYQFVFAIKNIKFRAFSFIT
jgi:hypothetical protein